MSKLYLLLLITVITGLSCQQQETLNREEVIAAIQRFDEGWKNKNAKIVDSVLASSYVYYTQSGGTFDRKNVVHTAGSADYKLDNVERKVVDIRIEGTTAVVNTVWKARGSYYDAPFDDSQRCSITIIKKNDRIEILAEHCTPIK